MHELSVQHVMLLSSVERYTRRADERGAALLYRCKHYQHLYLFVWSVYKSVKVLEFGLGACSKTSVSVGGKVRPRADALGLTFPPTSPSVLLLAPRPHSRTLTDL